MECVVVAAAAGESCAVTVARTEAASHMMNAVPGMDSGRSSDAGLPWTSDAIVNSPAET